MGAKTSKWLLVGKSGCGKTTVYNNLTNSERKVGNDVTPITTENDSLETSKIPHYIAGYTIYLIDTEGFGTNNDKIIKKFTEFGSKLDGIIFCCKCGRLDMSLSFEIELLKKFEKEIMQKIVFVYTFTDHLEESFDDWKQKNQRVIPYNFEARIFGVSKKHPNTYKELFDYLITTARNKKQEKLWSITATVVASIIACAIFSLTFKRFH